MISPIEEMVAEDFEAIEDHIGMNDRTFGLLHSQGILHGSSHFLLVTRLVIRSRRGIIIVVHVHRIEFLGILMVMMMIGRRRAGRCRAALRIAQRRRRSGIGRSVRKIVRHVDTTGIALLQRELRGSPTRSDTDKLGVRENSSEKYRSNGRVSTRGRKGREFLRVVVVDLECRRRDYDSDVLA